MSNPIVLFALNEETRQQFLPNYRHEDLPPFEEIWVDVSKLKRGEWEEILAARRPDVLVTGWITPAIPDELVRSGKLPLGYVCNLTGSIKGIVSRDMVREGLLVSNWGSTISYTIAEHALLLALGALRSVPMWRPSMESLSENRTAIPTRSLHGKRIGIHGFGAIARHLISLLKPFGVTISVYSAGVPTGMFHEHGVRRCESLDELVAGIEVMIECEAWTPQTQGSVDARILGLLPPGTVFVNVGRGAVVDEVALGKLATEGRIVVGLDVYEHEPLPLESPLQGLPNVLLSPHIAGPTHDALPLCGDFAISNLRHYLSGQPDKIAGVVTLEIYDRIT